MSYIKLQADLFLLFVKVITSEGSIFLV